MKNLSISALVLGATGAIALLVSFALASPSSSATQQQELASIWGGNMLPQEPTGGGQGTGLQQAAVKTCRVTDFKCKDLYNDGTLCFGGKWTQTSACPGAMNCIPRTSECDHNSFIKRCIGPVTEECSDTAETIDCGVVSASSVGECTVSWRVLGQNPQTGQVLFECWTAAGECKKVGASTDLDCGDTNACDT